ncbi:hypothetical protein H310_07775 [Aphanomyces invadans]|uniref:Uncharacterized protein n=1 Tax=Aphanomyces invadans TaxID=157072 RepID=A0A024TZW8_9STRA|nr:hypothetical protein H310_07775 [Aphanomyces invadans]ETV99715.1 hypothetical protein H310_07775 [Aphanomyces invadans]|eukprot:XP_008871491.1 hypothetical protein H310_07775 [Aphanomyces invadans]
MYLKEMCVIDFDINLATSYESVLRSVQRTHWRGAQMCSVCSEFYINPWQHVVYTNKSFIHHHYKCRNHRLYDPSGTLDIVAKEKEKV